MAAINFSLFANVAVLLWAHCVLGFFGQQRDQKLTGDLGGMDIYWIGEGEGETDDGQTRETYGPESERMYGRETVEAYGAGVENNFDGSGIYRIHFGTRSEHTRDPRSGLASGRKYRTILGPGNKPYERDTGEIYGAGRETIYNNKPRAENKNYEPGSGQADVPGDEKNYYGSGTRHANSLQYHPLLPRAKSQGPGSSQTYGPGSGNVRGPWSTKYSPGSGNVHVPGIGNNYYGPVSGHSSWPNSRNTYTPSTGKKYSPSSQDAGVRGVKKTPYSPAFGRTHVPGSGVVPGYVYGPGTGHKYSLGWGNVYGPGKAKNYHGHIYEPKSRYPFRPRAEPKYRPGSGNVRVPGTLENYYRSGLGDTDKPGVGHASGTGYTYSYRPGTSRKHAPKAERTGRSGRGNVDNGFVTETNYYGPGSGFSNRPGAAHEGEKGETFGPGTEKINYGPGSGQTYDPASKQKYESVSEQNRPATSSQIDGTESE